jgi:hypothetical protein
MDASHPLGEDSHDFSHVGRELDGREQARQNDDEQDSEDKVSEQKPMRVGFGFWKSNHSLRVVHFGG